MWSSSVARSCCEEQLRGVAAVSTAILRPSRSCLQHGMGGMSLIQAQCPDLCWIPPHLHKVGSLHPHAPPGHPGLDLGMWGPDSVTQGGSLDWDVLLNQPELDPAIRRGLAQPPRGIPTPGHPPRAGRAGSSHTWQLSGLFSAYPGHITRRGHRTTAPGQT